MQVCRASKVKAPIYTAEQKELVLTESLRLKQVGLLHANVAAPGQEVGGVVAGEEGTRRSAALARHLPRRKQLNEKNKTKTNSLYWCDLGFKNNNT